MRLIDADNITYNCSRESDYACASRKSCSECDYSTVTEKDIKSEPTVEAVPLSVIGKIHDAVDNADYDARLEDENGSFTEEVFTKEHVHEIIDKAVKECTHEQTCICGNG